MKIFIVNIVDFDGGIVGRTISQKFFLSLQNAKNHLEEMKTKKDWRITSELQGEYDKHPGERIYGLPKKLLSPLFSNWDYHPTILFITEENCLQ